MSSSAEKSIVLAVLMALCLGTAFAADANSTKSMVTITNASFKAPSPENDNLIGEWVEIANEGSVLRSLQGWTLSNQHNRTYAFNNFTLAAGAFVKVHTGIGNDTATDLFWNRKMAVWNNDGDLATLKDAVENVVSIYPREPVKA